MTVICFVDLNLLDIR